MDSKNNENKKEDEKDRKSYEKMKDDAKQALFWAAYAGEDNYVREFLGKELSPFIVCGDGEYN